MHEMPVTQSVLEIALRHAESAGAQHITDIYLVIGQLSSFVDDAIQFYWDIISAGTIAQGATLHFERIPAEARCNNCGQQYRLEGMDFTCPQCGGVDVQIVAGQEFYVDSINVETDEADEETKG